MHLSSSSKPSHEFKTPDGEWYCIFRAVVYDSWLTWQHVLPEDLELREQLDARSFETIKILGKRLHSFHHSLPDYKTLDSCPFKVPCWWDPTREEEEWNSGRTCLLSVNDYSSEELIAAVPKRNPLRLKAVSENFVEASLPLKFIPQDLEAP